MRCGAQIAAGFPCTLQISNHAKAHMKTNAPLTPIAQSGSGRPTSALLGATRFDPAARMLADTDIAILVEDVLRAATYLPIDVVRVRVDSGWVTLSGELDWKYQKQAAAKAVADLRCVVGVSDRITIRPKVSASVVRSDIEAALTLRARTDARNITVEIRGGDVTLGGIVHSLSERDAAWHSAWGAPGVRNVVDRLTVTA